jgi:hypothetical protein
MEDQPACNHHIGPTAIVIRRFRSDNAPTHDRCARNRGNAQADTDAGMVQRRDRSCPTPVACEGRSASIMVAVSLENRSTAAAIGETTARSRREESVGVSAALSVLVRCEHLVGRRSECRSQI